MRQFNGMDSLFLYMDGAHAGMHGAFLQIYAPMPGVAVQDRFKVLLEHVRQRLDASPAFRRTLVRVPFDLDHAWWRDGCEVDLGHHVRHCVLPLPGTAIQLAEVYSRLTVQPMDLSRPLWEIHVVDGLDAMEGAPRDSFALVVKFHHAGADGVSATEITSALHGPPAEGPAPAVDAMPRESIPAAMRNSARLSLRLVRQLGTQLPHQARTVIERRLRRLAGVQKQPDGPRRERAGAAPRSLLNVPLSGSRSYTFLPLPLDSIRGVRERVPGATVNDVFLATVGGALRKFLLAQDGLPGDSLVGAVPVNVRQDDERGQAGNQFSIMRMPLRTDEPDPLRRLQRIAALSAQTKQAMGGSRGARKSVNLLSLIPAPLLAAAGGFMQFTRLTARLDPLINLVVTNVPGPRAPLFLAGARLLDINGVPPLMDGLGLVVAASSYDGALRVAVGGDIKVMPEPTLMKACMLESFEEVVAAAGAA